MAKKTFEESMTQLEKIIEEIEGGDLPLEKALKKFEEGVSLSKFCLEKLEETEKKVNLLLKDHNGCIKEVPFSSGETDIEED